jgi:hypothetical protein
MAWANFVTVVFISHESRMVVKKGNKGDDSEMRGQGQSDLEVRLTLITSHCPNITVVSISTFWRHRLTYMICPIKWSRFTARSIDSSPCSTKTGRRELRRNREGGRLRIMIIKERSIHVSTKLPPAFTVHHSPFVVSIDQAIKLYQVKKK